MVFTLLLPSLDSLHVWKQCLNCWTKACTCQGLHLPKLASARARAGADRAGCNGESRLKAHQLFCCSLASVKSKGTKKKRKRDQGDSDDADEFSESDSELGERCPLQPLCCNVLHVP